MPERRSGTSCNTAVFFLRAFVKKWCNFRAQNAFAAGALSRTQLGAYSAPTDPLAGFQSHFVAGDGRGEMGR